MATTGRIPQYKPAAFEIPVTFKVPAPTVPRGADGVSIGNEGELADGGLTSNIFSKLATRGVGEEFRGTFI